MATGTGISAGNRALKARLRDRKLPSLETRAADPITQASLETLAEHLRVYEGDVRAPKERFITLKELEDAGLIKTGTKSGYAYIAQVLQRDVAQKAGSTANPSLKGVIKKDTSRQSRTPGGGGGGGSATNPIEVGKSGQGAKLNDNFDVLVPSPAQREFLYYDGSKWTAYPLFKRENKWFAKQYFAGGIDAASISVDGTDIADIYVNVTGDTVTGTIDFTVRPILTSTAALDIDPGLGNDSDIRWLEDGTLTALLRWDSSENQFLWQDRAPGAANRIVMDMEQGWIECRGSSYTVNPAGIRMGQYSATVGYIQAPVGGAVHIWDDGTVNIATFNDDGTVDIPQGTLELGTYATTAGGVLKINGTTVNKQAELICTNGNLHIDSNDGQQIYLNYYSNTGGVYIGAAGGFKSVLTGEYGSVQTQGTTGGYGGVSLAGNFALMNSGSAHVGMYNDVNNQWMWLAYPNAALYLYYAGTQEVVTQNSDATGNTTGAQIKFHNQSWYDIGLNQMPRTVTNGSVTLSDSDAGGYMYHSNASTYTITLNNSSPGGADFPIGGTYFVLNYGTGNITVDTGSGTLYNPQLGTGTTGSRTIGGNSVATILKYAADSWFVWGDNVT